MPSPYSDLPELATNKVDVRQAMETLSFDEMKALGQMYTRWALTEPELGGDERTSLIELSSDYERIAKFVGESWKPSEPNYPPDAVAYVARLELKDARERERDTVCVNEPGNQILQSKNVSEDELFTDPAQYLLHLADTLCAALRDCDEEGREDSMWWFRKFAEKLANNCWGDFGDSWVDEIRATLSPDNHQAMHWANTHIDSGIAWPADANEAGSVTGRLSWPIPPGGRARDD